MKKQPSNSSVSVELFECSRHYRAMLFWRFGEPRAVLSSAAVGSEHDVIDWIINIGVESDYGRRDLDTHVSEITETHDISGPGIALFTAADVKDFQYHNHMGVDVYTTVGVTKPTWPHDRQFASKSTSNPTGTINIIAHIPRFLSRAAAVNAVMTITEAKTQALIEAGIDGTGTASDAVVLTWPAKRCANSAEEPVIFCGCRSLWGSRLATATYLAVSKGLSDTAHGDDIVQI